MQEKIESLVHDYGDMLYRLCAVMLGTHADAQDAVQDVLVKFLQKAPDFASPEHEKAWLLTVAANRCRDLQRHRLRHPQTTLDALGELPTMDAPHAGILDALLAVPEKFRIVLTLHYVEGYSVAEIAKIIGRTPSAVKMRLQKGRALLKSQYEEGEA